MRCLVRDDFRCRADRIGLPACDEDDLDLLIVHHIKHRFHRGTHALENLVTLCKECHAKIHPHLRRELEGRMKSRELPLREL